MVTTHADYLFVYVRGDSVASNLIYALKLQLDQDIIGITESLANDNISDAALAIKRYRMLHKDKLRQRGGSLIS